MLLNPAELLIYLYGHEISSYNYADTTLPMHVFLTDQIIATQSIQK